MWHVEGDRIERLHNLAPFVTEGDASVILLFRSRHSLRCDPTIDPPLRRHR